MTQNTDSCSIYNMKKQAIDYTSFRIRRTTLKKIKVASVKADMSIAKFIDLLLESYLKKNRI